MRNKIYPLDGIKRFNWKSFTLGFLLALALLSAGAVQARWSALTKAWKYPQVVQALEISQKMEVKK